MRHLFLLVALLFSGLTQAGTDPFATKPEFLPVDKAFVFTSQRLESGETQLFWQIADGYYLYQKRLKFDGLPIGQQPALPQGEAHSDGVFGEQQVYRQGLELKIPAGATGQVKVGFQGCADAGLCYPPQTQVVDLGNSDAAVATDEAPDQALASGLQKQALGWSLLVFFGLGLLLAFTPCSLPMLPILAGLIVGSGASTTTPYTPTITVSDGTNSAVETFTWFISQAGPVIVTYPGDQTSTAGDQVALLIEATDTLYHDPGHPYTRLLFAATPDLYGADAPRVTLPDGKPAGL